MGTMADMARVLSFVRGALIQNHVGDLFNLELDVVKMVYHTVVH